MSAAVRMRTTSAGPEGVVRAGAVVRVSRDEAAALIAGGYADLVAEEQAPLTATPEPVPAAGQSVSPEASGAPVPSDPVALAGSAPDLTSAPAPADLVPPVDAPASSSNSTEGGEGGGAGDDSWTSDAPQALASAAAAEGRRTKRTAA